MSESPVSAPFVALLDSREQDVTRIAALSENQLAEAEGLHQVMKSVVCTGVGAACLLFFAAEVRGQDQLAETALSLVNEARAEENLKALELEPPLMEAAQAHADDMLERDYYGHKSPEGDAVRDRFLLAGGSRWNLVAENIARCEGCDAADADRVRAFFRGWMQSTGHRENILARGLDGFGFGIAAGADTVYAVQTFAGPGTAPGGPGDTVDAGRVGASALEAVNAVRGERGQAPLDASRDLDRLAAGLAEEATWTDGSLSLPDPFSKLPEGASGWTGLAVAANACSGCGAAPAASDGAYFGDRLSAPDGAASFTHFGFALSANGEGRKIAVGVFGRR